MIKANEAKKTTLNNLNSNISTELTKMATIEKNIKKRCNQGAWYLDYQPKITYAMAQTLIENGFKLSNTKSGKTYDLADFRDDYHFCTRISWNESEE